MHCQIHLSNFSKREKKTSNLLEFMPGRSTTEAIHLLRQLIKRFRERKRNLHMVFIDLEKAYDKVPREVLWWTLMKTGIPIKYIDIIKDIYDGVVANVRTCGGITSIFLSELDCIKDLH